MMNLPDDRLEFFGHTLFYHIINHTTKIVLNKPITPNLLTPNTSSLFYDR